MLKLLKEGRGLALLLLAIIVVGAAACQGCSATAEMQKQARTGASQLGRIDVLIDQCSEGSTRPESCAQAKGGTKAVADSLQSIIDAD